MLQKSVRAAICPPACVISVHLFLPRLDALQLCLLVNLRHVAATAANRAADGFEAPFVEICLLRHRSRQVWKAAWLCDASAETASNKAAGSPNSLIDVTKDGARAESRSHAEATPSWLPTAIKESGRPSCHLQDLYLDVYLAQLGISGVATF